MPDPSDWELGQQLYRLAVATALGYGRAFRPEADDDLRQMINQAATETLNPTTLGAASSSRLAMSLDARIIEAERAITNFVQTMAEEARSIPNYSPYILGEETLSPARARFCPVWPFC